MKVVIELSKAQQDALEAFGETSTAAVTAYADSALNNKLKSTAMSNLKRVVLTGEATYKKLPPIMKQTMSAAQFISELSSIYYGVAKSLGGRTMKDLDVLIGEILEAGDKDAAIEQE